MNVSSRQRSGAKPDIGVEYSLAFTEGTLLDRWTGNLIAIPADARRLKGAQRFQQAPNFAPRHEEVPCIPFRNNPKTSIPVRRGSDKIKRLAHMN
jgi:hypothetical protein